jgi:hypothetical protein
MYQVKTFWCESQSQLQKEIDQFLEQTLLERKYNPQITIAASAYGLFCAISFYDDTIS